MTKTLPPTHRHAISPFDLPELVELIVSFLSRRELVSSLQLNHRLYSIILPRLWRQFCIFLPEPLPPPTPGAVNRSIPSPPPQRRSLSVFRDRLPKRIPSHTPKIPESPYERVFNRSRDPALTRGIYKFRQMVQILDLEFFAGVYLQHFVDSPLYRTQFGQPYNPLADDPKCSPPRGLVSLKIKTGLSKDTGPLAAQDSICPMDSFMALIRWNRWLTVLQLPSLLLLSERGIAQFMDILLGVTQLQDLDGGVLKSGGPQSRSWPRASTSLSAVAAATVATSSLCLQNLESLTIGSEGTGPRILPYDRIVLTRFVQACCARLPRLHQLHLFFIIGYRSQREDYSGDLPLLEAMLASVDLTTPTPTSAAPTLFSLPSPSIRILTLPRGVGSREHYMGNDLVECVIENWVKNLDELSVPGYVPEWKDTLRTLVKKHHPHIERLDLD